MKFRFRTVIICVLIAALLSGGAVYARTGTDTIDVTYRDITVYKDNVPVEMVTAAGTAVEPFIYNGTTYVPLRNAAEMAGMQVEWVGKTSSIYMWDNVVPDGSYLTDVCPPYGIYRHNAEMLKIYTSDDGKSFSICGEDFSNGIVVKSNIFSDSGACFNLDGKYESMTFTLGPTTPFYTHNYYSKIGIYLDDELVAQYTVSKDDYLQTITLPLDYALQMRIVVFENGDAGNGVSSGAAMGNIILE